MDGKQPSRSLKVTQQSEARIIRQALITEYNENPVRFTRQPANPTAKVQPYRLTKTIPNLQTAEEIDRVIEAATDYSRKMH